MPASLLKGHIYSLAVFGGEGHFHVLLPQFFLHKGQRVIARRQPLISNLPSGPLTA